MSKADNIYGGVLATPGVGFDAVRDGRRAPLLYVDVDLSTARTIAGTGANAALVLNISGNVFFADKDPTYQGAATVHFQDVALSQASAPVYVDPGFIAKVPFTQLLIENAAQAGKRLRIVYGTDVDLLPGTGSGVSVVNQPTVLTYSEYNAQQARRYKNSMQLAQMTAGGVSQCAGVYLYNPPASGKTLIVNPKLLVWFDSTTGGPTDILAFGILTGLSGSWGTLLATGANGSVYGGGGVGVSKLYGGANVGALVPAGVGSGTILQYPSGGFTALGAGSIVPIDLGTDVVLPAGYGFAAFARNGGTAIKFGLDQAWNEI